MTKNIYMKLNYSSILLIAVLFLPSFSFGQSFNFGQAIPSWHGGFPYPQSAGKSIVKGDFNNDGKPDLAFVKDLQVSIMLGNGDGTFNAFEEYYVGQNLTSIATGDFNSDSKPDLAVTDYSSGMVKILFGTGDGTFGNLTNYVVGANPNFVAIRDFNNDGKADLAVANFGSNNVSILLGAGNGMFASAINYNIAGSGPSSHAIGDFNSDGNLDLAVAVALNNSITILLGIGDGTFTNSSSLPVGNNPQSIVTGDLNGDGNADLVVANFSSSSISILLGTGTGLFGTTTFNAPSVIDYPLRLALGDINNDGNLDLAITNPSAQNIAILSGNGHGSFTMASVLSVAFVKPNHAILGDFNNDGKTDIATTSQSDMNIWIFPQLNANSNSIQVAASGGGYMNPQGYVGVNYGGDQTITIHAYSGYRITDVLVDGISVGAVSNFTFTNVTANHTISVVFDRNVIQDPGFFATSGPNGTIFPTGVVTSWPRYSRRPFSRPGLFTMTPDPGFIVKDVVVDGISVGAVTSYTFTDVSFSEPHSISVTFGKDEYLISASAGANGTITPAGDVSVVDGGDQIFNLTPNAGYIVDDVLVDGNSVGAVSDYTFTLVDANHTISATFKISSAGMKQAAKNIILPYLNNADRKISEAVKKAVEHIDKSLEAELWDGVNHLTAKGNKVFDEEKQAVKELTDKKFTGQFSIDALAAINYLLTADNNLAQIAINEVECNGDSKCAKEIQKANENMAKAIAEQNKNNYDKAIDLYKEVWKNAREANKKLNGLAIEFNSDVMAETTMPDEYQVAQNYPNPFNPSTVIKFGLPQNSFVTIKIYDMIGREIRTLINGERNAGFHNVQWNGDNDFGGKVSSGTYVYRIQAGSFIQIRKMILMK